jgi:hypothetical protein
MTRRFPLLLILPCVLCVPLSAWGATPPPDAATTALAKELTKLLDQQKIDAVAARLEGDTFVAALYMPGSELLAISAKYTAPALLNEKILGRRYKDVYTDLATASVIDSKIMIEDSKADGIRAMPGPKEAFDVLTHGADAPVHFDGKWKDHKLTEQAYEKSFLDAESAYRRMLEAMIAELKRPR